MIARPHLIVAICCLFACARHREYAPPPIPFFEEVTPRTIHTWIRACPRPLWIPEPNSTLVVQCLDPKRSMMERDPRLPAATASPRHAEVDEIEFEIIVTGVDDTRVQIDRIDIMSPIVARRDAILEMIVENVALPWREHVRAGLKGAVRRWSPDLEKWAEEVAAMIPMNADSVFRQSRELFGGFRVSSSIARPRVTISNAYQP